MSEAALPLLSELRLFCLPVWSVETETDSSFHVDISLHDEKGFPTTVEHLKREIKKNMREHDDVAFKSLSLYKVSIMIDDDAPVGYLSKKVEENRKRTQTLSNTRLIKKVFPTQPDYDNYHILVDFPGRCEYGFSLALARMTQDHLHVAIPDITLKLWCILSQTGEDAFPISINGNSDVHALKQTIKEAIPNTLGHLDSRVLRLFDVSSLSIMMDESFDEHIKRVDLGSMRRLNPAEYISKNFGSFNDNRLHVIVRFPSDPVPAVEGDSERRDTVAALDNRFRKTLDSIRTASSPSESAKSSGYPEAQKRYGICDGRNETAPGPPVELFHPVFAHFLNDLGQETSVVAKETSRIVVDYMKAAAKSYTSEDKRRSELTKFLPDIIGQPIELAYNSDNTRPDGMVRHQTQAWGPAVILLKEDKNELGDGGSDPSTQVGLSYARTWAQNDVVSKTSGYFMLPVVPNSERRTLDHDSWSCLWRPSNSPTSH
ncbi:hypothetical protein APHAL10511_003288 [Amanita phalloides]|nr:hypothetical protein APHAL10511_003288 [Amanita phalloides]